MREVTFGDFAKLANRRGLTPEYLAERFTDKIERPSEFFHRRLPRPVCGGSYTIPEWPNFLCIRIAVPSGLSWTSQDMCLRVWAGCF